MDPDVGQNRGTRVPGSWGARDTCSNGARHTELLQAPKETHLPASMNGLHCFYKPCSPGVLGDPRKCLPRLTFTELSLSVASQPPVAGAVLDASPATEEAPRTPSPAKGVGQVTAPSGSGVDAQSKGAIGGRESHL